MALRALEATVPAKALEAMILAVKDAPIIQLRPSLAGGELGILSILVESQHAETVSDLLVSRFGSYDEFRLIVYAVETTIPSIPIPEKTKDEVEEREKVQPVKTPDRISREELYDDIAEASRLNRNYVVMVILSTVVAAVGLMRGDVAIIIGAMVIAPLLGPNVALALAATLGDAGLARRSSKVIGVGLITATALSVLMGLIIPFDPAAKEIAARTNPGLTDIVLGLAAGIAGAMAFTSGVSMVVVGVMVAVALMPPTVVVGLSLGAGEGGAARGAFLLLMTNVACVNLAAVTTFFFQGVRPRGWWETGRAKTHTIRAAVAWSLLLIIVVTLILLDAARGA